MNRAFTVLALIGLPLIILFGLLIGKYDEDVSEFDVSPLDRFLNICLGLFSIISPAAAGWITARKIGSRLGPIVGILAALTYLILNAFLVLLIDTLALRKRTPQ